MPHQPMPPASPRLWVILARGADKAVIIRRGPSDWTRLSVWHTGTDQVEHGQWLHARLYPERCDLSPDGSLFVYFAYHDRGGQRRVANGYSYAYTAISRPPYFTALALWNAFDTWGGGGMFADNRRLWVSAGECHPDHPLPAALKIADYTVLNQDDALYRSYGAGIGWRPVDPAISTRKALAALWRTGKPYQFFRESRNRDYRLERTWYIDFAEKQRRYSLYTVQRLPGGDPILLDGDFTWADWDQHGRLVGANRGRLEVIDPDQPNGERHVIADFNGQNFEEVIAPDWARQW